MRCSPPGDSTAERNAARSLAGMPSVSSTPCAVATAVAPAGAAQQYMTVTCPANARGGMQVLVDMLGVSELGHKWNRIAERLPGRTDHAIRNRFHRLQSLLQDRQRQQQRILAPNMPPLPVPMTMPMGVPTSGAMVTTVGGVQSLLACADGFTPGSCESSGYETPVGTSTSPRLPN